MSKIGDYIIGLEYLYATEEKHMPTVDEIYPNKAGDHLKAEDLQGHEVRVSIEKYEIVDFDDGKKIILFFTGKKKTLVTNKTNAKAIAASFGNSPDDWVGRTIFLYPATTEFNNKTVPCLRVRPELPVATADTDDDIPW